MKLHLYMDGDEWCCVDSDTFNNIQRDPVGFGRDPDQAIQNFLIETGAKIVMPTKEG